MIKKLAIETMKVLGISSFLYIMMIYFIFLLCSNIKWNGGM